MTRWIFLCAALLLVAAHAVPVQAQRVTRSKVRAPRQPRAFTNQHQPRAFRQHRNRARFNTRLRQPNPRFYGSGAALRVPKRLRVRSYGHVYTTPRQTNPRLFNQGTGIHGLRRMQGRLGNSAIRLRRPTLRRINPSF
jgi:hypothetical protein